MRCVSKNLQDYTKEELIEQIQSLKKAKKFGLVWEDKPEQVAIDCETKLPVLQEVADRAITKADDQPTNLIIEGDNYHSLSTLNYTHAGKIDVIYIDPPYNTGNKDFIYNDHYIDREDTFRHSKWLSFMSKRLSLAKTLLSDDGVMFISIGEDEYAQLKLLCDQIFGEQNYITNFLWEKTQHFGRQKVNFYSNGDFILCYAKRLKSGDGLRELLVEYQKSEFEDAPLYNASNPVADLVFPANTVKFNIADGKYSETTDDKYKLLTPVTVKNGLNKNDLKLRFRSRWSAGKVLSEATIGTTYWVKSQKFAIRAIYADGKTSNESPKQILFTNKNNEFVAKSRVGTKVGTNEEASSELRTLVGDQDVFNYPKPVSLIEYLLSLYFRSGEHPKNATILDFFAGSGTTGQAVLSLNKKDKGKRQFILCTNNEGGIAENVTYRRINKVTEHLPANVSYFKTDFVDKADTTDQTRVALVARATDMIKIRENTFGAITEKPLYKIYASADAYAAIIFDPSVIDQAKAELAKLPADKPVNVYVFSLANDSFESDFADMDRTMNLCPIPESILEVYKRIFTEGSKK